MDAFDPRQPHGVSGLFRHEPGEPCVVCDRREAALKDAAAKYDYDTSAEYEAFAHGFDAATPDAPADGWSVEEQAEEDGSWTIRSLAMPGLVVAAETREEAWRDWPAVVELWAMTANTARVIAERLATPDAPADGLDGIALVQAIEASMRPGVRYTMLDAPLLALRVAAEYARLATPPTEGTAE